MAAKSRSPCPAGSTFRLLRRAPSPACRAFWRWWIFDGRLAWTESAASATQALQRRLGAALRRAITGSAAALQLPDPLHGIDEHDNIEHQAVTDQPKQGDFGGDEQEDCHPGRQARRNQEADDHGK